MTAMKLKFLLPLSALALTHPFAVRALDCAKAALPVEKLFCATPELKKADEAMSAAYLKLLRETTDSDFHEALIRSQRRWLEARAHGPDRFGQAEGDTTDDRKVLSKMTHDRLTFLQTAEPIRTMERQRKITSEDGGGTFDGFRTYCVLQPPPYGNWAYECWGEMHRQHNDKICSTETTWASGHITEYRLVSVLRSGTPKLVATCSTGYASTSAKCPEINDTAETKAISHWNTNPEPSDDLTMPHAGDLWKYDPDVAPREIDQQWMHDCLFASTYPPPKVSRPNSTPQK